MAEELAARLTRPGLVAAVGIRSHCAIRTLSTYPRSHQPLNVLQGWSSSHGQILKCDNPRSMSISRSPDDHFEIELLPAKGAGGQRVPAALEGAGGEVAGGLEVEGVDFQHPAGA